VVSFYFSRAFKKEVEGDSSSKIEEEEEEGGS